MFFSAEHLLVIFAEDDTDCISGPAIGSLYNTHSRPPTSHRQNKPRPPNVALPVDADDYLGKYE